MVDDFEDLPPMSEEDWREYHIIMRHAAVEGLKLNAAEVSAICKGVPKDRLRRLLELIA